MGPTSEHSFLWLLICKQLALISSTSTCQHPPLTKHAAPRPPNPSLGHFLLVRLLEPALLATARACGSPSRVVSLSSSAHFGPYMPKAIREEADIDKEEGYAAWAAYGQSKLCNVLLAR